MQSCTHMHALSLFLYKSFFVIFPALSSPPFFSLLSEEQELLLSSPLLLLSFLILLYVQGICSTFCQPICLQSLVHSYYLSTEGTASCPLMLQCRHNLVDAIAQTSCLSTVTVDILFPGDTVLLNCLLLEALSNHIV